MRGRDVQEWILIGTLESSEISPNSSSVHKSEPKPIKIVGQRNIYSVAFLGDGKHIVSGGDEGKIRRWQAEDGKEVGTPMDAGSAVLNLAVSRDGKRIVSGTVSSELTVWNAQNHEKVTGWKGHSDWVRGVDISPDGTRIATGSDDSTACVWSLSSGQRLLGPWEHNSDVVAVKFSPDGRLIVTATLQHSIRVYDSQDGLLLIDVPIEVASFHNQSLVWAGNSKNLFALSLDGKINYVDVSTGTILSSWSIHSSDQPGCIALASNGTFIAASADSSVLFWDTTTHKRIGSIRVNHTNLVMTMAISANYDLVTGGGKAITLQNICEGLPSSYYENVSVFA